MPLTPAQAAESLKTLRLKANNDKTALIIGGTTGIGEAVAYLLAKVGFSRVSIVGRNAEGGASVVEKLNLLSEGKHEYIKGDVGDVKGMKSTADAIIKAAGSKSYDYVFMTQNGTPSGIVRENADGEEVGFVVQAQSRFALAYLLTEGGALAEGAIVMSIANTGISLDDLDVEDLSLKRRAAAGRSQALFFFDQSKRDSSVIDAVTLEFNARYPQYTYMHLHPGLVKTAGTALWGSADKPLPFPWSYIFPLGYRFASQTAEEYAPIPIYLALHSSALGGEKFFNHRLVAVQPGRWAQSSTNREALWKKLLQMMQ